jgi:hypothetical protein
MGTASPTMGTIDDLKISKYASATEFDMRKRRSPQLGAL